MVYVNICQPDLASTGRTSKVWGHLQKLSGEADGQQPSRAAHAAQIVHNDVGSHPEMIDDHGRKTWRWAEDRAVYNQYVNLQHEFK